MAPNGVSIATATPSRSCGQEAAGGPFDLLIFGNESADTGGFQVGIRVAVALGRPVVAGLKGITVGDGRSPPGARRGGGWEIYELPLPAVVGVKEGINLPRYPSVPGRLRARKKEIDDRGWSSTSGPAVATGLGPEWRSCGSR